MNKERYQKFIAAQRKQYEDKVCEWCGNEHDHSYGTGRFCSNSCRMSYIASQNKKSEKNKAHLARIREQRIHHKAPYGTWKCVECNLIFEFNKDLCQHMHDIHGSKKAEFNIKDKSYICPYCREPIKNKRCIGGHMANCKKHPNKAQHDEAHKTSGKHLSENYKKNPSAYSFKGRKMSLEAKQKISQARVKWLDNDANTKKEKCKVKWYKVKNLDGVEFSLRGTWEQNVALRLNELGVRWSKPAPLKYFKDYWHNYVPDLHLDDLDIYIEVKGNFSDADKLKMKLVLEQHPDKKFCLVHDEYRDFVSGNADMQSLKLLKLDDACFQA